jgi:hypothetical protein
MGPFSAHEPWEVRLGMDGLQRVTFRFGHEIEVRYLPEAPERGDPIANTKGLWVVTVVSSDDAGVTVVCEPRDGDDARHVA